jgi:hypothetical protein
MKATLSALILWICISSCQLPSGNGSNNVTTNSDLETADAETTKKWEGNWQMGEPDQKGLSSNVLVSKVSGKTFNFTINAVWLSSEPDENVHIGQLEGIAEFQSPNEAWFQTDDYFDYRIVFKLNNNVLIVSELNTDNLKDYTISPDAGKNVRYAGIYQKLN